MELGLCIEVAPANVPFKERFQFAADAGFKNVEMWSVKDCRYDGTPEELVKLADDAGVKITNTASGGELTNPASHEQWLEQAKMTLEFNKAASIPATIVCAGNKVSGLSDEQMMDSVVEGLKPTLELAEKAGITLLMEPLNDLYDHPGHWLTSSDRGAGICRTLKSDRMKLLFDCYHMQIMEGDLVKHIERNIDVIGHFHSAGVPGRNELYKGETNYPFVLEQIEKLGYQGVFGLEYSPSVDDAESLRKTLEYIGR